MASAIEVEQTEVNLPLELTVEQAGTGGITGLVPTVAIRNAATTNSYLDWSDHTFKTAGWTTKYAAMADVERGHYHKLLNVSAFSPTLGFRFTAEYHVDDGAKIKGDDMDLFIVTNKQKTLEVVRRVMRNAQVEQSGNPGTLTVFDDDGTTPFMVYELLDETGGPIVPTVGTPAIRSKASP